MNPDEKWKRDTAAYGLHRNEQCPSLPTRPAQANYNGRTRPLLGFPAGKLQLRDVGLRVDDAVHLTASFGS